MVQRVYEQVVKSQLDTVVVATDDERIFSHVKGFGGRVVMTSDFHKSGTDRCAEVADRDEFSLVKWVVNIQGDEPFIQPGQIDKVVSFLRKNNSFEIATLAKKIESTEKIVDPNTVKVVFDKKGKSLYFSRSAIPFVKNIEPLQWATSTGFYKHIGIYGFQKEVLLKIAKLPTSPLEKAESLEQLRWLENGFSIGIQTTDLETVGIDVPEDLIRLNEQKQ